jgi:hypothetical protein
VHWWICWKVPRKEQTSTKWVAHLRDNECEVSVVNLSDTQPTRERVDILRRFGSCHTAVAGICWVEGHVPADLTERLIAEQPGNIRGRAVRGMPLGSSGMEGPNPVEYKVLAYGTEGKMTMYATRQRRRLPK